MTGSDWTVSTSPRIEAFLADVKRLGPDGKDWKAKFAEVNEELSYRIAGTAANKARAMGGVQGRAADAFKSVRSASGIRVGVSATTAHPEALAAFWGAKKETGWNAGSGSPNLPPWVGNTWAVGMPGQGPYALNEAIAEKRDEVLKSWGEAIDDLGREAGFI